MEHTIDHFVSYMKEQHDLSRASIAGYAADARLFFSFLLEERILLQDVTVQTLHEWVQSLRNQGRSPATIARKIASLRQLFRFLVATQRASENLAMKIQPKRQKQKPSAYRIRPETLDAFERNILYPNSHRDLAAITLLGRGGLRISELVTLRRKNISESSEGITVQVEGGCPRQILFRGNCADLLRHYWQPSGQPKRAASEPLFPNNRMRPMTRQGFWRALVRRANRLGLTGTGPAYLRCAFMQGLIKTGAHDKQIAYAAGLRTCDSLRLYRRGASLPLQAIAS